MKELFLEVITPSKAAFSGVVKSVVLPGSAGGFEVLFNHAPIMSSLEIGIIKITEQDNKVTNYCTSGGTVQVTDNKILVLAESFESKEQIDADRAQKSMDRAKERMVVKYKPEIDEVRAEAALKRAINRLKLTNS